MYYRLEFLITFWAFLTRSQGIKKSEAFDENQSADYIAQDPAINGSMLLAYNGRIKSSKLQLKKEKSCV